MGQYQTSVSSLVPSSDPTVIAGYEAIYNTTANTILLTHAGQVELLFSLTGTAVGGADSIAIQAALQHPYRFVVFLVVLSVGSGQVADGFFSFWPLLRVDWEYI